MLVLLYQYVSNGIAVTSRRPTSVKRTKESLFPEDNKNLEMKTEKGYTDLYAYQGIKKIMEKEALLKLQDNVIIRIN